MPVFSGFFDAPHRIQQLLAPWPSQATPAKPCSDHCLRLNSKPLSRECSEVGKGRTHVPTASWNEILELAGVNQVLELKRPLISSWSAMTMFHVFLRASWRLPAA